MALYSRAQFELDMAEIERGHMRVSAMVATWEYVRGVKRELAKLRDARMSWGIPASRASYLYWTLPLMREIKALEPLACDGVWALRLHSALDALARKNCKRRLGITRVILAGSKHTSRTLKAEESEALRAEVATSAKEREKIVTTWVYKSEGGVS